MVAPGLVNHWDLARGAVQRGALQKVGEFAGLCRFVARRGALGTVLEVGTCKGGSLWAWCQLASLDALIVSVDLPGGDFGGGYTENGRRRIERYRRAEQRLELIEGDSHDEAIAECVGRICAEAANVRSRFQPVDLLFVDGDHTYEGVKQDWEMYSPLVPPGGLVVFHDILNHPSVPECQVDRFWREVKGEFRNWEFCHEPYGWGGIGVLEL